MASSLKEEKADSGDHARLGAAASRESSDSTTQSPNHSAVTDTKPGPPNQPSKDTTGTFAANPADPEVGLPADAVGPGLKGDAGEPDLTLHTPGDGEKTSSALGGEKNGNGGARDPVVAGHRRTAGQGWQGGRHLGIVGRVFLYILVGIGILVLFGIVIGLSVASAAANGAIILLIGNAVLKAAGHEGYVDNAGAAAVGAVGGIFGGLIMGFLASSLCPKNVNEDGEAEVSWYGRIIITVLVGTLSGPIGSKILGGELDVLHATRAGAVGGAILAPGALILMPFALLLLGLVLAPIFKLISMCVKAVGGGANWTSGYRVHWSIGGGGGGD